MNIYCKLLILQGVFVLPSFSAAPQFGFPIVFEDAAGHRDTVVFGYDSTATDGIDSRFDEININDEPFDSLFEVRITGRPPTSETTSVQSSKIQIVPEKCDSDKRMNVIEIHSRHWPVTASWDSTIFTGRCPKGGGITGVISDALTYTTLRNTEFSKTSRTTFKSHGGDQNYFFGFPYQTHVQVVGRDSGTVNRFWVTLSTETLKTQVMGIQKNHKTRKTCTTCAYIPSWLFLKDSRDLNGRKSDN